MIFKKTNQSKKKVSTYLEKNLGKQSSVTIKLLKHLLMTLVLYLTHEINDSILKY